MIMRLVFIVFICITSFFKAQTDSSHILKVHFLYGSKPKWKYRDTEKKYFGGLHGGHVSLELDGVDYGFEPSKGFHIFAHKKNFKSDYADKAPQTRYRYAKDTKLTTFYIPLTDKEYKDIYDIVLNYCSVTPYDYAFFGMRCAASAQDILGQVGILKYRKRFYNIVTTFYPKMLRKRFFKLAKKRNWTVTKQEGRPTRKWEKD
jgi:hypothetical protein